MEHRVLFDSLQALLLEVKSASPEKAEELFRDLSGRDVFVPRLTRWLEESRSAFPEPFGVEDLDSVNDPGVDVLIIGAHSRVRIGFQVKSNNDLRSKNFTRDLKAQILDAQRIGVEWVVLAFACAPTKQNLFKIKYWQNYALGHPGIIVLSPEKTAGLYERFEQPLEPIVPSVLTWPKFFIDIGQPGLAPRYLETWPNLSPDRRFLPPEAFGTLRQSLKENHLTFLVGSPAAGKTYTSLQLLWEAFKEYRTVRWITATDFEPTEGPIPRVEIGLAEKAELRRRVDGLLKTLGSPIDDLDIASRVLVPNALVYIEDPFGKSEDEYGLSLVSYSFFDFQRFVEELARRSERAGCRLLVTSREALFQRWLGELKEQGREMPQCSVIRLRHNDYYPGPLFDHAVLLGQAKGFSDPEAVAEVLVDHVEGPFELDTLIRSLQPSAGPSEAEEVVAGWEGELHTKIEGRITPRDDRDTLVLLLIAVSDHYESLTSPLSMYSKLHVAMGFQGEPKLTFDAILKRLSPFLDPQSNAGPKSLPFVPSHTIIREAIRREIADARHHLLLRKVARALPDIPPKARPKRNRKGFVDILLSS